MKTELIGKLNDYLRGEISAVETYEIAIRKTDHAEMLSSLRKLRDDHDRRVAVLRNKIREFGGEPTDGSGAWGTLAVAVEKTANLFGDSAALQALEEGEDHGLRQYESGLKEKEPVLREFVAREMMPEQRKSHDLCRSLTRYVKAA